MFAVLMNWMKARKMLPQISDTERQALEAGTVWIDGEFFGGNPDFGTMLGEAYNTLSIEEQAFLDGPCEELCRMIDRYTIAAYCSLPTTQATWKRCASALLSSTTDRSSTKTGFPT
jgi:acyl-CoA dehydrogenase